jgi:parallel beta-helix repeat protein
MQKRILHLSTICLLACLIITACKKPGESTSTGNSVKSNVAAGVTYYQSAPSYNSAFQTLIDQASPGDVIVLRSGSHYVTNPIILRGKNGITIRGEDGAVIRKASSAGVVGILIWSDYNTIHHLEIDGGELPESGIMIYGGHNNITDCRIHNCGNAGILLHMRGDGPVCSVNKIEGCQIYYNRNVGVSQAGHCDGTIAWCRIYENGYEGITVDRGSHNNVIANNEIARNNTKCAVGGIGLDASNGTDIIGNNIHHNKCRSGITFQNNDGGCDGTIVVDNQINYNDGCGIQEIWTRHRNTNSLFRNNTMIGNKLGTHCIQY